MKKIVFATQVISLLTILPLVMCLELNHVERKAGKIHPLSKTINKISLPNTSPDFQ